MRLQTLRAAGGRLKSGLERAGGGMILLALTIQFIAIVARAAYAVSFSWTEEVVAYALVVGVYLIAGPTLADKAHISVRVIVERLPDVPRRGVAALTSIVGIVTFAVITVLGAQVVVEAYEIGFRSPSSLEAPMFALYTIIPVGAGLLMLFYVLELLDALFPPRAPAAE